MEEICSFFKKKKICFLKEDLKMFLWPIFCQVKQMTEFSCLTWDEITFRFKIKTLVRLFSYPCFPNHVLLELNKREVEWRETC